MTRYFPFSLQKALLECEIEWSINKKLVSLKDKDIRHAIPNGLSYFMIEFASNPGYAHVIEDEQIFPRNFAEVRHNIQALKLFFLQEINVLFQLLGKNI